MEILWKKCGQRGRVEPERLWSLEPRTGSECCLAFWIGNGQRARNGEVACLEQLIRTHPNSHVCRLILSFNMRTGTIVYFLPEAVFLKQCMGARNRIGIELLYRPGRLKRLAESIPWNLFLGPLKVYKFGLWSAGGTINERAVHLRNQWRHIGIVFSLN